MTVQKPKDQLSVTELEGILEVVLLVCTLLKALEPILKRGIKIAEKG